LDTAPDCRLQIGAGLNVGGAQHLTPPTCLHNEPEEECVQEKKKITVCKMEVSKGFLLL